MKAKQGYEAPDELLAETSFGPIEGFFISSFVILFLLLGGSFFIGFYYSLLFFKIIGFVLLLILVFDIFLFITIKKIFIRLSKKITTRVKKEVNSFRNINIMDVDGIGGTQKHN